MFLWPNYVRPYGMVHIDFWFILFIQFFCRASAWWCPDLSYALDNFIKSGLIIFLKCIGFNKSSPLCLLSITIFFSEFIFFDLRKVQKYSLSLHSLEPNTTLTLKINAYKSFLISRKCRLEILISFQEVHMDIVCSNMATDVDLNVL